MLKGQGLPLEFWDEAASTGAYVRNRIMNGPTSGAKHSLRTKHTTVKHRKSIISESLGVRQLVM
jgi:hypothetical protein